MSRLRVVFISSALAAAAVLPGMAGANPPGVSLSIAGPAFNDPGVPASFGGVLSLAGTAGIPLIAIELRVDGAPSGTATTGLDGSWSASHTFTASPPYVHSVQAVAFGGTPLETQSVVITTTTVVITSIEISPPSASVPLGDEQQFTALATYSNGANADVTQSATWVSSDTNVAIVSNAPASKGLASSAAIGTTLISAIKDSVVGSATLTVTGAGHLVINEVDYDQPSFDTGEFIEIYNPSEGPVSLDGIAVVLVNGATNAEYLRVNLTGTLAAGGYALVSNSSVFAPAGVPQFIIGDSTVQNGPPDGIALLNVGSSQLIDALSYEGSITAAVITGAGTFNLVEGSAVSEIDDPFATPTASLARLPNGIDTDEADADWALSGLPTPGSANA